MIHFEQYKEQQALEKLKNTLAGVSVFTEGQLIGLLTDQQEIVGAASAVGIAAQNEDYKSLLEHLQSGQPLSGVAEAIRRTNNLIGWDRYGIKRSHLAMQIEQYLDIRLEKYPDISELLSVSENQI